MLTVKLAPVAVPPPVVLLSYDHELISTAPKTIIATPSSAKNAKIGMYTFLFMVCMFYCFSLFSIRTLFLFSIRMKRL